MQANSNEAMREALSDIIDKINQWREDGTIEHWQYSQLFDLANDALALPRRNCDVGSDEEQSRRFCAFCRPRLEPCDGCACLEASHKGRCEFVWAQMPYNEGGIDKR